MDFPDIQVGREILQFAVFISFADKAVLRVIREDELDNRPARVNGSGGTRVHYHPFRNGRRARWRQRPRPFDLHHTNAAVRALVDHIDIVKIHVAQGRNFDIHQFGGV
jgi:hypothetical protein